MFLEIVHCIAALTNISNIKDFDDLVHKTQALWLRRPGSERWQLDALQNSYEDKRALLMPLFEQLGMCDTIMPVKQEYKYGLFLGHTVESVFDQYYFLVKLLRDKKITLESVILLTGKRTLEPFEYSFLESHNIPPFYIKTEADMIAELFRQKWRFPIPYVLVDSPAFNNRTRPTTEDTVLYWLDQYRPEPGSCLAFSIQPVIGYQDAVLRTWLPKTFTLETVGSKTEEHIAVGLYLDTLARWLYQKNIAAHR
jgi:hypothetical protein